MMASPDHSGSSRPFLRSDLGLPLAPLSPLATGGFPPLLRHPRSPPSRAACVPIRFPGLTVPPPLPPRPKPRRIAHRAPTGRLCGFPPPLSTPPKPHLRALLPGPLSAGYGRATSFPFHPRRTRFPCHLGLLRASPGALRAPGIPARRASPARLPSPCPRSSCDIPPHLFLPSNTPTIHNRSGKIP